MLLGNLYYTFHYYKKEFNEVRVKAGKLYQINDQT